jgi:hypothetical protein
MLAGVLTRCIVIVVLEKGAFRTKGCSNPHTRSCLAGERPRSPPTPIDLKLSPA